MTERTFPGSTVMDFLTDVNSFLAIFRVDNSTGIEAILASDAQYGEIGLFNALYSTTLWDEILWNSCSAEKIELDRIFMWDTCECMLHAQQREIETKLYDGLVTLFSEKWIKAFQDSWDNLTDTGRQIAQDMSYGQHDMEAQYVTNGYTWLRAIIYHNIGNFLEIVC